MKNNLPPNSSRQQLLIRVINYFRNREGEPRLFTKRKMVLLVATILYAVSPIDLIPEALFGPLGLVDDMTFIAFVFLALFLPPIKEQEPQEGPPNS